MSDITSFGLNRKTHFQKF